MRTALFGGSFDPIHAEHLAFLSAAKEALALDRVFVIPSNLAPHKRCGAAADGNARLELCRIALRGLPYAEVSGYEIAAGGTSYSYRTCEHFAERFPDDELFFLVGADMLEDFFTWREPERILSVCTLAACGRGGQDIAALHEKFRARFSRDFLEVPFTGKAVSSTEIRVSLAFGKGHEALPALVLEAIRERGLYADERITRALALEKPTRQEHSLRVARLACMRARSLCVPEGEALLAAALHDCAKNLPLGHPLLAGFSLPEDVPEPVVHQFAGAYLAEKIFGIEDRGILNAIRYHASGRENMTVLEKLIFLSDLVEEGRTFDGVEQLRALFFRDLDACLVAALERQLAYLRAEGKPVYPLTERAYLWLRREQNKK